MRQAQVEVPTRSVTREDSDAPSTVIVVDDQPIGREVVEKVIRRSIPAVTIGSFDNAQDALEWASMHPPDLVITDYKMPVMDGVAFTRKLRSLPYGQDVPVVIVTVVEDRELRYEALEAGATDFLTKPIDPHECGARCRNLLRLHNSQKIIQSRADWLEEQVTLATSEIRQREHETLLRLAKAGEFRDEDTQNHVLRVSRYARLIALNLGLSGERSELIGLAAALHDIGKVGIPDGILRKNGAYTVSERHLMQDHTAIGHAILQDSPSKYLQTGSVIALCHHERYDGSGYPKGLEGDTIPIEARIVAVADVYDALTSKRPYKAAWGSERAFGYLKKHTGALFDPECVQAFFRDIHQVFDIQAELQDRTVSAEFDGSEGF